jgi:trimethylamine:corrinoid methyltransferase-like protein
MTDRMQVLSKAELTLIHDTSIEILTDAGVRFNPDEVIEIFRRHGFRIDGTKVYITENDVGKALETVPSRFTVRARNPAYNVSIGEDDFVFLPTGGAPNIATASGNLRPATLEDYYTCCRLVQTSDQLDMNGMLMVQPTDIPAHTAHLEMAYANMVMAGSSGPVSLPGLLALANAEILAGIVLAQLTAPGTPVVYGSVSAPADMRTIISAVGAPEAVALASAIIQIARYYKLPCRTGGMLTNAHCLDAQAAAEGTLMMSTAVRNGANFIYQACGQLGSYISMSFEKWLLDEEVCRTLRRTLTAMDITVESIDVDTIKGVGSDGNYLVHETTFKHCRNLYQPQLFTRDDHQKWYDRGARSVYEVAAEILPKRLEEYHKPTIDEGLEQALREFITSGKTHLKN